MKIHSYLYLAALLPSITLAAELPIEQIRLKIFDALTSQIERLDGEALMVRSNREKNWKKTIGELRHELKVANSLADLGRTFYRLDQAYPNLHSHIDFGKDIEEAMPPHLIPGVRFWTDWIGENETRLVVSSVDSNISFPPGDIPQVGDEIVAINNRSIQEWSEENFTYCKHPLRAQCDSYMSDDFVGRLLPATKNQELSYTLKRDQRVWSIRVPILETPIKHPRDNSRFECKNFPNRYSGFSPSYVGNRACVYESDKNPKTAILRITSFAYREVSDSDVIKSISEEIDALYPWWKQNATWDHLVIDLIDNGGGNAPIPYYQILFQNDFQEQYFRLKKFPELAQDRIRRGIFWNSLGQEIWFQNLLSSGVYSQIPDGDFLPQIPMFCADDSKDCSEGFFRVREHPFHGRISVLLNEWCVSSCDGFAYEIKDQLGDRARFFGHPQAADTAYGRLTIHVFLDDTKPDGFEIKIRPIRTELDPPPFFSQTVSVTRSYTKDGKVASGVPVPLDRFVSETLENTSEWVQKVLSAALE